MKTMGIQEASELLRVHPVTLTKMASSGEIPGAKIGKEWVFIDVDLIDHIRAKYKARALQGEHERNQQKCHSTNAKIPEFGGSKSPSLEKQYREALGLAQKVKPKNSMTS
ncbi:MAG: helix-turn-helix domain-containing protein [Methylophilus sp.]